MDLVRCTAFLYVVALHSIGRFGVYSQPVAGKKMMLMVIMRVAFMSCVPLFALLTGYLTGGKQWGKGYYKGLKKTLAIYLLGCAACILFRKYYMGNHFDLVRIVTEILNYSAAPYGWYIEMYLGLFLLTPFLNAMYHSLSSKRHKQALLLTFIGLTLLPQVVNSFPLFTPGWWLNPAAETSYTKIIPAWWIDIWPLPYYFWGVYRSEYPAGRRPLHSFLLYLASALLTGGYSIYRSYGAVYGGGLWDYYDSLFVFFNTILLFEWLASVKIPRAPWVGAVLRQLSDLCLGAYLVSYIFDELFYPSLLERVPALFNHIVCQPLMVLLVAACSFALSFVLSCIWKLLERLGGLLKLSRPA